MSNKLSKKRKNQIEINSQPSKRKKLLTYVADDNPEPGVVLVMGAGDFGQLGLGPEVTQKKRPALINIEHEKFTSVVAGAMHTVCLTTNGEVYTFGCNDEGALGRLTEDEDLMFEPKMVNLPEKVIQISAGDSHSAALLKDGRVFAWGNFRDTHGSMGLIKNEQIEKLPVEVMPNIKVVKIASGVNHIALLSNTGNVYTFGCGEQGQLGRFSERNFDRNSRFGLANLLKPSEVRFQFKYIGKIENIWAGHYSTFCKVAKKNEIIVFGLNNYNQLGLSDTSHLTIFHPTLSKEFSKYEWKDISPSTHHTIALNNNGLVFAIGRKDYGRLGLGSSCTEDKNILSEVMKLNDQNCTYISTGLSTSFAISAKRQLYVWGAGNDGMLGTGNEEDCLEPVTIQSQQLSNRQVLKVSGGGQHTALLATDHSINGVQQMET